jgi:FkbM family methyltransferase
MRGIGRYTLSLTREMARLRAENEMFALVDALYPERVEELRQIFVSLLPAGAFLPYYHNSLENAPWLTPHPHSDMAEALIEQAYQVVSPDVVLTPSLFEGWGGGTHGKVPLPDKKYPNQQRAVILYDIIPLVFQKQYLDPDPLLKKWYLERIEMLQNYDLLLAISEATRQDAIKILGLNPNKVINISGAASSHFKKLELSEQQKRKYLNRFGISRPFVLYLGGNDFRKNMDGALRAFAKLPPGIMRSHQLVLNDVGDETFFRSKARKLGLDDSDLVIFKRATDDELAALYNLSKVFVFPSLYEGFGLPVLEAMSCGTAVLASNNSSLPEVVGREDALFDVNDEQEIVDAINRVLTDDAFRADLAAYGLQRAKEFSWEVSAQRAWEALEDLVERKKSSKKEDHFAISEQSRYRIAYISPFPPQKSGIADYSADFLPYLAEYFDIDLFTQPQLQVSDQYLIDNFAIFSWDQLKERHHHYDMLLYHMGNGESHIPMWRLLEQLPGVVVSHDFFMSNLPFVTEVRTGERGVFFDHMDKSHGLLGLIDYARLGREKTRWRWPMNWPLLKNAQELIVHSEHQNELIRKFYRHGWKPKPTLIRHFRESVPVVSSSQKRAFREELNLGPNAHIFCSFGFMAPTKLNNLTIQAFSQALPELGKDAKLIFVGELEGGEYGQETLSILQELDLQKKVEVTGYLSKEKYEKYLACADVAIQLRMDSRGETSGALLDCLAYGLPTIVNNHGSFKDYPSDTVLKLFERPDVDELSQAIVRMKRDDDFRSRKGQRARNLIAEKHHPEKIAAAYRDVITKAIRTKDQKVFAPLIDAIYELGSPDDLLHTSAKLAAKNLTLRSQPRILIDVTGLDFEELSSGKKATANCIKELLAIKDPSIRVELVHVRENELFRACRVVEKLLELPSHSLGPEKTIPIRPGDVFVVLTSLISTHGRFLDFSDLFENIHQTGGQVVTLVESDSIKLFETPVVESNMLLCILNEGAKKISDINEWFETDRMRSMEVFYLRQNATFIWEKFARWLLDMEEDDYFVKWKQDQPIQKVWRNNSTTDGFVDDGLDIEEDDEDIFIWEYEYEHEINLDKRDFKYFPISLGNNRFVDLALPVSSDDPVVIAYKHGEYLNQYLVDWLEIFSKPGGNIIDLGCHMGTMSVPAAAIGRNVLAVDANKFNIELVRVSALKNQLANLSITRCAISDKNGQVSFHENGLWGMVSENFSNDLDSLVPTRRVDTLLKVVGWNDIDLVKMDIEGSELAAFKSMESILQSNAPVVIYESNGDTFNIFGYSIPIIREYLEDLDYRTYRFENDRLVYCPPSQLQPEAWLDLLALPPYWQDKMRHQIVEEWDREAFVQRCLQWGKSQHQNVREYLYKAMKSDLDYPKDDPRLIQLKFELSKE